MKDFVPGTEITIYQTEGAFKYTTDSLILSSFSKVKGKVLDAGCGNGILSLRIISRASEIVSVDIDSTYIENLKRTLEINKIKNIRTKHSDILELSGYEGYFDTVITNPPYFADENILKEKCGLERHSIKLYEFMGAISKYLKYGGRLFMVFPTIRLQELSCILKENELYIKRLRFVKKEIFSKPKIMLLDIRRGGGFNVEIEPDFIMYENDVMTEEFLSVYRNEVLR